MSIGTITNSSGVAYPRRITVGEAAGIKVAPVQPDRIERMFDRIDRLDVGEKTKKNDDLSGLSYYKSAQARVTEIISNLPDDTSSKERDLWNAEISGINDSINYYNKEISSYQNNNTQIRDKETTYKVLSNFLNKSVDEIKEMHQNRLDKKA